MTLHRHHALTIVGDADEITQFVLDPPQPPNPYQPWTTPCRDLRQRVSHIPRPHPSSVFGDPTSRPNTLRPVSAVFGGHPGGQKYNSDIKIASELGL